MKEKLCANCKHERRFHAIAEHHNLGTTHCTKLTCYCKEFIEEKEPEAVATP